MNKNSFSYIVINVTKQVKAGAFIHTSAFGSGSRASKVGQRLLCTHPNESLKNQAQEDLTEREASTTRSNHL